MICSSYNIYIYIYIYIYIEFFGNAHYVKSVQIQRFFWSVFSSNTGKCEPEKTPYLDTFHAVTVAINTNPFVAISLSSSLRTIRKPYGFRTTSQVSDQQWLHMVYVGLIFMSKFRFDTTLN